MYLQPVDLIFATCIWRYLTFRENKSAIFIHGSFLADDRPLKEQLDSFKCKTYFIMLWRCRCPIKQKENHKNVVFLRTQSGWGVEGPTSKQTTVDLQWLEHWWLVYHGCFEHVLGSVEQIPQLQIWDNLRWFSFSYSVMVYCVYSLESPQRGDSNEYTQYTFMS